MRWRPGESGNPSGRRPGAGKVGEFRAAIAEHVPAIVAKLVEQAKDGDAVAARLLLERVLPPVRPTESVTPFDLPPDASLTDAGRAIIAQIADGSLAPTAGSALVSALGSLARVAELDELQARVAALEGNDGKS